ncbi:MAG: B12-binding domain-containing radical SAM protein [Thermodesulfobacteriota bacterium]
MNKTDPIHPKGAKARILLSSVFGPFARDDAYGSRAINPMELYQNQVTRVQGAFSLRMFHRSFGLLLIQSNLDAPCTLLDFPSLDRFVEELKQHSYDVIGISAIIPNVGKVKKMCALIREHQPDAVIVIGGHISNKAGLAEEISADHIVRGDGVKWFRRYTGQRTDLPVRPPIAYSAFGSRILGIDLNEKPGEIAAILIPSVGCPVGCNFCSTSALFGGKGKFINFYETGDELFQVMGDLEKKLGVKSFFVLDENFLLHRKRALRLLELMELHGKSWMLNVFSSARVLRSYTMEQLVGLGIGWVWMGIEGKSTQYRKLRDIDTRHLVADLQSHGIRVLGSSIIGLEDHTPANIHQVIEDAVDHGTDFHQFMLYTPNPGTPLYEHHKKEGNLLDESVFPPADAHGQYRFSYRHAHIRDGQEEAYLLEAFQRDFTVNGPSLGRLIRTLLTGWQAYKHHPDHRIRERYRREVQPLRGTYAGAVWAMRRYYRSDKTLYARMDRLLVDIGREFGWKTRLSATLFGIYAYIKLRREENRLAAGWQMEPDCFYEKNTAARFLDAAKKARPVPKAQTLPGGLIPQRPLLHR